jgi:hypothetical protein
MTDNGDPKEPRHEHEARIPPRPRSGEVCAKGTQNDC